MTWNYRLMKHVDGNDTWFEIHEVHYDCDGSIYTYDIKGIYMGDTPEEANQTYTMMGEAFLQDALEFEDG